MTKITGMKKFIPCVFLFLIMTSVFCCFSVAAISAEQENASGNINRFAGSKSCRECHERFFQLWSKSFHGLAMQPYSSGFAAGRITAQQKPITIGEYRYLADFTINAVVEEGPDGQKRYPIEHVMGGRDVYYFLTTLDKGRLQTLPVAYDVRRKEWYDTALSGVRHFPDQKTTSALNNWKDVPYTFNTACRDCHVSQRSNRFDAANDTFSTTWKEPGINCETCHGPSEEHNTALRATPKGEKPKDYKIIRTKIFTPAQHNDSCSSCHAKAAHLTSGYKPPERFFDHFDLATLEDQDYYPDGRDLGENYTVTSWMLSPCVKKGKLHCVTCHTSSGRYRFKKPEDANKACLPCHENKVQSPALHTHHKPDSTGSRCVSCHMPTTEFARIRRSDHSMLPPTPATTIRYKSPNACNICHSDKDAVWADAAVRSWRTRDYQAPVLKRASLIDAARNKDWSKLEEILSYITDKYRDDIFAASLVRLLEAADFQRTTPTLLTALRASSPLLRGAAADALARVPTSEVLHALAQATGDDYRLVRVMAAGSLSNYPQYEPQGALAEQVKKATDEYLEVLASRPINWVAHYNMGNYFLNRNNPQKALDEYGTSLKLNSGAVMPHVNSAIALVQLGQKDMAEDHLKKSVILAPDMAISHYNLGLLAGERGDLISAEKYLRDAFAIDPRMADAAYRLCMVLPGERQAEAIAWCRKSVAINPDEPNYAYSLAVIQSRSGDFESAISTLDSLIERQPGFGAAYLLQGELYQMAGQEEQAMLVYHRMSGLFVVGEHYRRIALERIEELQSPPATDERQ